MRTQHNHTLQTQVPGNPKTKNFKLPKSDTFGRERSRPMLPQHNAQWTVHNAQCKRNRGAEREGVGKTRGACARRRSFRTKREARLGGAKRVTLKAGSFWGMREVVATGAGWAGQGEAGRRRQRAGESVGAGLWRRAAARAGARLPLSYRTQPGSPVVAPPALFHTALKWPAFFVLLIWICWM